MLGLIVSNQLHAYQRMEEAETLEWNPKKGVLCKCKGKERSAIKVWDPRLDAEPNEVTLTLSIPI